MTSREKRHLKRHGIDWREVEAARRAARQPEPEPVRPRRRVSPSTMMLLALAAGMGEKT